MNFISNVNSTRAVQPFSYQTQIGTLQETNNELLLHSGSRNKRIWH